MNFVEFLEALSRIADSLAPYPIGLKIFQFLILKYFFLGVS
jgi:hypothetical protein